MMPGHEKRVLSLDGLRGLAALIVFLYHVDIMVKPFGAGGPSLFPGTASVMVFFILSGIVLSLVPFKHMGNGGYDWLGYYPRRVVRLCVPLFAAIALVLPVGYVAWRLGSTSRSALAVAYDAGLPTAVHDILMQFDVLFAACLVVVVVAIADGFTRRALSAAPMVFLGKVSYSLYLTHAIVIGALAALLPRLGIVDPLAIAAVSLPASMLVSVAFWRIIEVPSMNLSRSLASSGPRDAVR